MFGIIAAILVVMWLLGFFALHISSFLIHVLLVVAVVAVIMHLVRGRRV
ncbi:MAG TPA: lmo0937 family membrane protein [Caulobacteraceae bacterium]|nr:lmo0937 family membrane protein [Caulobacteraceae bacterium]